MLIALPFSSNKKRKISDQVRIFYPKCVKKVSDLRHIKLEKPFR
jgi:hypothetical protein